MASNVSAEKLVIFVCNGGTFVTVYAAGSVKSRGITGLAFDSTNGEPKVGCNGELLISQHQYFSGRKEMITYSGLLRSNPSTVRSCPIASEE